MSIRGMTSLLRKLEQLGGNSKKAVKKGVLKATHLVQGDAKDLCPVDEGQLRNSITAKVEETRKGVAGKIGTNVKHAPYVEFGTGQRGEASPSPPKSDKNLSYRQDWAGMPAQPYLYPALKQNEDRVKEIVKEEIREEIRKLGRG